MPDPTDNKPDDELHRLREHNKQLLAELKTARTEAKTLQDAAEAATARANEWKVRYHQSAVLEPLEADLRGVAAGPWKYLRDILTEQKLLAMEPDAEGIERPVWRDETGEPADLTNGLHRFLLGVCERNAGGDLPGALRGIGASGGGASASASPGRVEPEPERKPDAVPQPPAFGLR